MISVPFLALALLIPLQTDDEAKKALEIFKSAVRSQDESARASAVADLAKVPHKKTLSQVAGRLMSDGKTVRIAAAKGLANFTDQKRRVLPVLARALAVNKKEPMVKAAILDTIGILGDVTVLNAVHREFADKDVKVCTEAFKAAGKIKSARSVDPILKEFRKLEVAANQGGGVNTGGFVGGAGGYNVPADANARRRAQAALPVVRQALEAITGQKFNMSKDAVMWWRANRGSFKR